jgi:integrase
MVMVELVNGYRAHIEATSNQAEVDKVRLALKPVKDTYADVPVMKFGPVAYGAVRMKMVDSGLCISTIRARLGVIKRMIAWGVAHEMAPADTLHRIQALEKAEPLRAGKDRVKRSTKVRAVDAEHIRAILPHVNPTIRTIVEVQALTGMRPGEVWRMTTGQIDRTGELWLYVPDRHKTDELGKVREIPLGPKAQEVLKAWLKADPDAPLFSPIEAVERRNTLRRKGRQTPHTPSSRARKRKRNPLRKPRRLYDKNSYKQAIERGCLKAGVPVFRPNQVRHSFATRIRREFGLDVAQVMLGHSKADVTQVYAEANREVASEVALKIG